MKKLMLCVTIMSLLLGSCAIPTDLGKNDNKTIPIPGAVTVQIISLTSVTVSWNPVSDAASYSVFRSLTGEADSFTRVKVTHETSWTDTGLTSGTTYYYQVSVAINNRGESNRSATVSACPMLPTVPVNIISEVISANRIDIFWDASQAANSYKVYRANTAAGTYTVLSTAPVVGLSYTDSTVVADTEYYYKVAGVNNLGESVQSTYTFSETTAPPAPEGLNAAALSETQITVSWNSVSGALSYKLYRSEASGGPFLPVTILTVPHTSYVDTSLNSATEYFYQVSAVNGIGEGTQSGSVSAVTKIAPPSAVNATPNSATSIAVTWNGVAGAINYYIYRATNEDGPYVFAGASSVLSYSDTISDTSLKYYYKVSALNATGESTLSVYTSVEFIRPQSPSGLSAFPQSATSLTITWDASPGASSYKLYHSSTTITGTYNLLATVDAATYTHTGLTLNTDYYYKVAAVNVIGEGELSAPITGRITAPPTPANVRVEPLSEDSIRISWDPVPGALMYSVYGNTSNNVTASTSYAISSTTDTFYIHTGRNPFTQYYYKVAATNDIGTSALTATAVDTYTQPIPLEEGVWYSRTTTHLSYSSNEYYSFPVDGGNYFIQWGNVGHTAERYENGTSNGVSAYWNSTNSMTNLSTSYFLNQQGGLANPRRIQAPASGYIIIRVYRYGTTSTSYNYDIRFYKE